MAEETEKVEEDIVVEMSEEEAPKPEKVEASTEEKAKVTEETEAKTGDEELDSYSKGVQSRIKKLTEKYRQEERDKAEALRVSQELLDENKKLKSRVQALDTGYLSEYGTRLQSQTEAAKRAYKEAYDAGDSDKMVEAQQALSNIAVETQRYNTAKVRAEQQAKARVAQQQQPVQQQAQQQPVQQQAQPDPRAMEWKDKNTWFGEDKIMTAAAFALHSQLTEEEGFDPNTEEYYSEVDSRMRKEFPHKFQTAKKSGGGSQVASASSSASRSNKQGRRSVKLSHSQVAIAKKLGVPLEEYAKYVKE
jgi:fused signal recognition particle receptor